MHTNFQVPEVLFSMPKLTSWELSGNYINHLSFDVNTIIPINKLDLRLNVFERPLKLTSFFFQTLTVLDLRRGGSITELDLSNLSTIQVIYCSYLSLRTIQVNGTFLREFYAEHNGKLMENLKDRQIICFRFNPNYCHACPLKSDHIKCRT